MAANQTTGSNWAQAFVFGGDAPAPYSPYAIYIGPKDEGPNDHVWRLINVQASGETTVVSRRRRSTPFRPAAVAEAGHPPRRPATPRRGNPRRCHPDEPGAGTATNLVITEARLDLRRLLANHNSRHTRMIVRASRAVSLRFPALPKGTSEIRRLSGRYLGGSFGGSFRIKIP